MISTDRIRRRLRALEKIEEHELADAFALIAAALLERGRERAAVVVHAAVMGLREIAREQVREARRSA